MDRGEDLMWTCEAFGIPDVNYQWLRNGQVLVLIKAAVIGLGITIALIFLDFGTVYS